MAKKQQLISLVVPLYNEAENVRWFYDELTETMSAIRDSDYEIVYVNDGSQDKTDSLIRKIAAGDPRVVYVCLARNFGKEAATSAGLHYARGEAVIILDGDGQHPPALIAEMVGLWRQGVQHVVGIRTSNRKAGIIKRLGSRVFYMLTSKLGAHAVIPNATDFRLVDRDVVDVFKQYKEKKRMTRALLDWSGFNTSYMNFEARDREHGIAAYNIRSLARLAVNGYIGATLKPLYLVGAIGGLITILTSIVLVALLFTKYILDDPWSLGISGAALITLFATLLVGILMISQGIVAIYVANIHLEAQDRPLYIVNRARSKLHPK